MYIKRKFYLYDEKLIVRVFNNETEYFDFVIKKFYTEKPKRSEPYASFIYQGYVIGEEPHEHTFLRVKPSALIEEFEDTIKVAWKYFELF